MKYTVIAAIKTDSFSTEHGSFDKYALQLKDESGATVSCYINQKSTSPAPEAGSELNGSIEQDARGNDKFKKESSFGGGGGGSRNDPETRKEIIRQSSLAQAVNFCTAKAGFMEMPDAKKYMTGMEVLQVATYFAAYAEGRLHVKMTKQDIIDILETEGSFEPAGASKEAEKPKKNFDQQPDGDHLIHSQDIDTGEEFTIDVDDFDNWQKTRKEDSHAESK